MPMPTIVQTISYGQNTRPHFSVLLRAENEGVVLLDAPHRPMFYDARQFASIWTGNALALCVSEEKCSSLRAHFRRAIWGITFGRAVAITSLIAVTAIGWQVSRHHARFHATSKGPLVQRLTRSIPMFGPLVLLGFLGLFLAWRWEWIADKIEPRPMMSAPRFVDFGSLDAGEHKRQIEITNDGTTPLTISKIQTTCSCVSAEDPGQIPPGEKRRVSLAINPIPGTKFVDLVIWPNGSQAPQTVRLKFVGPIRPVLFPDRFEFSDSANATRSTTARLFFPGDESTESLRLESIDGPTDLATIELQAGASVFRNSFAIPPFNVTGERTIAIKLLPKAMATPGRHHFKLQMKHREVSFTVNLLCDIRPFQAFSMSTNSIVLSSRLDANGMAGTILDFPDDRAFAEYRAVADVPWLRGEVLRAADGRKQLRVLVVDDPRKRVATGVLRVAAIGLPKCHSDIHVCRENTGSNPTR